jgi:hypothetical protein
MTTPGTRVYAVRNADKTTVYAYGFGVYLGDLPHPGWEAYLTSPEYRELCERSIRGGEADDGTPSRYAKGRVIVTVSAPHQDEKEKIDA